MSSKIQTKYNIAEKDYKSFLCDELKGEYPYFPFSIVRHIILGILNKELHEKVIISHNEILNVACASLEDLIKKEPTIGKLHLELLYNCIDSIEHDTRKCILNKNMCNKVCSAIKKNPKDYFSYFVRLGMSTSPFYNVVACEPFYEQIFGNQNDFEEFLLTLSEEQVPKIKLTKNFWLLYKHNDYTSIQFDNQGNIQEIIDNNLTEEVEKLHKLLGIKKEFEEYEKERETTPRKEGNSFYIEKYQTYKDMIDNDIKLYIKLTGDLKTQLHNTILSLKKTIE